MSPSSSSLDVERICLLLLARLLAVGKRPPSRLDAIGSVHKLLTRVLGDSVGKEQVEAAFDRCIARGLLVEKTHALSADGREALRAALGVRQLPRVKDWRDAQQKLLPSLVLGAELKTKGKGAERIAAAIVAKARGVAGDDRTLKGVLDVLAWRALGRESNARFDAASVQRWLLRELVEPDARVSPSGWRRLVAAKLIGAQRADADGLRRALLAPWLMPQVAVAPAGPLAPAQNRAQAATPAQSAARRPDAAASSLTAFAKSVLRAAHLPGVARFHGDRAFIGSLWEQMRERPPVQGMTLAEFKDQLVHAHRKGLIHLTRADLVGAMDPAELRRSEARYLDASFHFVALESEPETVS